MRRFGNLLGARRFDRVGVSLRVSFVYLLFIRFDSSSLIPMVQSIDLHMQLTRWTLTRPNAS